MHTCTYSQPPVGRIEGVGHRITNTRDSQHARSLCRAPRRNSTAETVESGIASSSLISAAVMRTRRSAAIAVTRSSLVRRGTRCGAEERSSSPDRPSRR
jgi:hypothetical protein